MADTQLIAAEQLMNLLDVEVVQAKEAVLTTSAQLDPPGPEILFVTPALCAMTGHSREAKGDKVKSFILEITPDAGAERGLKTFTSRQLRVSAELA